MLVGMPFPEFRGYMFEPKLEESSLASADSAAIESRACNDCDVAWFGASDSPCWCCGGDGRTGNTILFTEPERHESVRVVSAAGRLAAGDRAPHYLSDNEPLQAVSPSTRQQS